VNTVAVLVVRDGVLPGGAGEAVAEAGGAALLAGTGTAQAAREVTGARRVWLAETSAVTPGVLVAATAPLLRERRVVVLPASADGRDLAPRLAFALDRPLITDALAVTGSGADVLRGGSQVTLGVDGPFVATLRPGVRGVSAEVTHPEVVELTVPASGPVADPVVQQLLAPVPGGTDLADAPRVLGAGAGLGHGSLSGPDAVALLRRVGDVLGASVGATRVVTDAGWTDHARQIGTTGVVVNPELYVAFGVSGAGQHVGGLGHPRHVVSVNTDPSCPMTALADLGIVADAPATLMALAARLLVGDDAEVAS
jgi:electron transfer flavoprotein alpha subunit